MIFLGVNLECLPSVSALDAVGIAVRILCLLVILRAHLLAFYNRLRGSFGPAASTRLKKTQRGRHVIFFYILAGFSALSQIVIWFYHRPHCYHISSSGENHPFESTRVWRFAKWIHLGLRDSTMPGQMPNRYVLETVINVIWLALTLLTVFLDDHIAPEIQMPHYLSSLQPLPHGSLLYKRSSGPRTSCRLLLETHTASGGRSNALLVRSTLPCISIRKVGNTLQATGDRVIKADTRPSSTHQRPRRLYYLGSRIA